LSLLLIIIMAPVELQCSTTTCDKGEKFPAKIPIHEMTNGKISKETNFKLTDLMKNVPVKSFKELETQKIEIDSKKKETDIDDGQILKDVRNFKTHFKLKDFLMNIFLGLAPSAWDIGSDFTFAHKLFTKYKRPGLATISLIFIALPGLVFVSTLFQQTMERCTKKWNCPTLIKKAASNGCSVAFAAAIVGGLVALTVATNDITPSYDPDAFVICIILAITVAVLVLSIKILAVFVHTEQVRKLSVKATNYEGSYESSLQLLNIMNVWLIGIDDFEDSEKMAMASSLVMIAKSGAENFLTFGAENLMSDERSILSKLRILAKFIPVFLLTGFFRIGTIAAVVSYETQYYVRYIHERAVPTILAPLGLALPLLVVCLIKLCGHIPHLSLTDIVQGVVGEMTSIVLWGRTGREGSRKLQLWVGGYLLLLYTGLLAWVMALHDGRFRDVPLEFSAMLLASGWIGYGLFIYQVYMFNWRKKIYLVGLSLAGH